MSILRSLARTLEKNMAISKYGAVLVIADPERKQVDLPSIISFKTKYQSYLKQVEDANTVRKDDGKMFPLLFRTVLKVKRLMRCALWEKLTLPLEAA